MQSTAEFTVRQAKEEKAKRLIRRRFSAFFAAEEPQRPYHYGPHNSGLIEILQAAMDRFKQGISSYIVVNMPPRHSKSDVVSRRFSPWAFLQDPSLEIILASYNYNLAADMSIEARRCWKRWAPVYGIDGEGERDQVAAWSTGHGGALYATGIGGTITGRGGDIILVDDPHKNREEAESALICDKIFDSFRNDLMTRLAPVHIVVIVMNRWGQQDVCGKIGDLNDPTSDQYDPKFPKFERFVFPAQAPDGSYLLPKRYSPSWYESQRAMAGSYGWQSQYQQDPQPRHGNMLRVDCLSRVDDIDAAAGDDAIWLWGFDLASSEKERNSDDPDYTHGTMLSIQNGNGIPRIFIKNIMRTRSTAIERNRKIRHSVESSGATRAKVESVAGYKDTWVILSDTLRGKAVVDKVTVKGSLFARAAFLEPIFEAGNVVVPKGAPWLADWEAELRAFPNGRHDDAIASLLAASYDKLAKRGGSFDVI